jgi:hypothetical protein
MTSIRLGGLPDQNSFFHGFELRGDDTHGFRLVPFEHLFVLRFLDRWRVHPGITLPRFGVRREQIPAGSTRSDSELARHTSLTGGACLPRIGGGIRLPCKGWRG